MTQEQYDNAREEADGRNLSDKDVTGGSNGYPEPYIGRFISGFDNLQEAEEFAKEFGGNVYTAHWRDGWHNVELSGRAYEEFEPSDEDYGDNYEIVDVNNEEEFKNAIEQSYGISNSGEELEDDEIAELDKEELLDYKAKKREYKQRVQKIIDDASGTDFKNRAVLLYHGNFYDTVANKSMGFSHDTHNYEIGVWLDNSEIEDSEDEESETMGKGGPIKNTAELKFQKVMHEFGQGKLTSHGEKVTDKKQAIAIAFSEARKINPKYGIKADGGKLNSIYSTGTAQQLWSAWDKEQRAHFLIDHSAQFDGLLEEKGAAESFAADSYDKLPKIIRKEIVIHHAMGIYKEGARISGEKKYLIQPGKIYSHSGGNAKVIRVYEQEGTPMVDYIFENGNIMKKETQTLRGFISTIQGEDSMKTGGTIKNQYKGKTPEQVWNGWNSKQRIHFIIDHEVLKPFKKQGNDVSNKKWNQLPDELEGVYIKHIISQHVDIGQYKEGSKIEGKIYSHSGGNAKVIRVYEQEGTPMVDYIFENGNIMKKETQTLRGFISTIQGEDSIKTGGTIKNQYEGKTPEYIWNNWNTQQREHFYMDHIELLPKSGSTKFIQSTYSELPLEVKDVIMDHVLGGSYSGGGKIKSISESTSLLPDVIAYFVAENVIIEKWEDKLGKGNLKKENDSDIQKEREKWENYLVQRAEYLFKNNKDFRKKVKASGTKGRDYLYLMMNHWMGVQDSRVMTGSTRKTDYAGAEQSMNRWVESIKNEKKYNGGKIYPKKQKLQSRIIKLQTSLGNIKSESAKKAIQKKIDKLKNEFDYKPTAKELVQANKGKFAIDVPAKYSKRVYKKLWSMNVLPRIMNMQGTSGIMVNGQTNLLKAYKVYSDMLREEGNPVPSLKKISRKL